jgi:hypothetical protein
VFANRISNVYPNAPSNPRAVNGSNNSGAFSCTIADTYKCKPIKQSYPPSKSWTVVSTNRRPFNITFENPFDVVANENSECKSVTGPYIVGTHIDVFNPTLCQRRHMCGRVGW